MSDLVASRRNSNISDQFEDVPDDLNFDQLNYSINQLFVVVASSSPRKSGCESVSDAALVKDDSENEKSISSVDIIAVLSGENEKNCEDQFIEGDIILKDYENNIDKDKIEENFDLMEFNSVKLNAIHRKSYELFNYKAEEIFAEKWKDNFKSDFDKIENLKNNYPNMGMNLVEEMSQYDLFIARKKPYFDYSMFCKSQIEKIKIENCNIKSEENNYLINDLEENCNFIENKRKNFNIILKFFKEKFKNILRH